MTQQPEPQGNPTQPEIALKTIQSKINHITQEYSSGHLNRAQFYAMYRHYTEKRTIIQKLLERDPETNAWKAAATPGATTYLRERFEARPIFWVTFRRGEQKPLRGGGKIPQAAAQKIHRVLQAIWKMDVWRTGLARKDLGDGLWVVLAVGEHSMTVFSFALQPSTFQIATAQELHEDFERANHNLLGRGLPAERMVFPQRALLDGGNSGG